MKSNVIDEALWIMNEKSNFVDYLVFTQNAQYNASSIVEDYIDYLEKLVVACSDCMYDYNVAALRRDFVKDYESYYGDK